MTTAVKAVVVAMVKAVRTLIFVTSQRV